MSIIKIEVKLKQSEVHFHTCLRLRRKFCGFPVLVKNLLCSTLFLAKICTTLLSYLVLNCYSRSISVFIRSTSVYSPDVFVSLFFIPRTFRVETIQDFLIKLDIKPLMHLLEMSIFSLNNVIIRLTKIMNRADKNWAHF